MRLIIILSLITLVGCAQKETPPNKKPLIQNTKLSHYVNRHPNDSNQSISMGSVSNGNLKHGQLIPFSGNNFDYFDETSYLNGRAFLNSKVLKTILNSYALFETLQPKRKFKIMECAHEHGGKLWPHRTHQNGLSVDFMMPKLKDSLPYYGLDTLGSKHYWLTFNNNGQYNSDTSISIDFELIAQHILTLQKEAKKHKLKIAKVIIKIELKDELFAGKYGGILKESGIYVVNSLTTNINSLHDEHYHIDFKEF